MRTFFGKRQALACSPLPEVWSLAATAPGNDEDGVSTDGAIAIRGERVDGWGDWNGTYFAEMLHVEVTSENGEQLDGQIETVAYEVAHRSASTAGCTSNWRPSQAPGRFDAPVTCLGEEVPGVVVDDPPEDPLIRDADSEDRGDADSEHRADQGGCNADWNDLGCLPGARYRT